MWNGSYEYYYDNRQLEEKGNYKNGEREGPWVGYYRNGTVNRYWTGYLQKCKEDFRLNTFKIHLLLFFNNLDSKNPLPYPI